MGVLVNIDDLIRGGVIEPAHVEFKDGFDLNVVVRGGCGAWRRDVSAVWGFWIGDWGSPKAKCRASLSVYDRWSGKIPGQKGVLAARGPCLVGVWGPSGPAAYPEP